MRNSNTDIIVSNSLRNGFYVRPEVKVLAIERHIIESLYTECAHIEGTNHRLRIGFQFFGLIRRANIK